MIFFRKYAYTCIFIYVYLSYGISSKISQFFEKKIQPILYIYNMGYIRETKLTGDRIDSVNFRFSSLALLLVVGISHESSANWANAFEF